MIKKGIYQVIHIKNCGKNILSAHNSEWREYFFAWNDFFNWNGTGMLTVTVPFELVLLILKMYLPIIH